MAEQWRAGHVHSFHLVEVTYGKDKKGLCTEGFGVGLMAALIKRRAKGKKADSAEDIRRGRRALSALVSDAASLDLAVNIDGKPWKGDLISVDVLNIPFTGPALPLAHHADPGDTLLDVIGFERDKRDELIEWIKSPQEVVSTGLNRPNSERTSCSQAATAFGRNVRRLFCPMTRPTRFCEAHDKTMPSPFSSAGLD